MPSDHERAYVGDAENERLRQQARSAALELEEINEFECSQRAWEHVQEALRQLRGA